MRLTFPAIRKRCSWPSPCRFTLLLVYVLPCVVFFVVGCLFAGELSCRFHKIKGVAAAFSLKRLAYFVVGAIIFGCARDLRIIVDPWGGQTANSTL